MKSDRVHDDSGFSFIELMVVIVILGILATFVTINLIDTPDEARQSKARVDIKTIETALQLYKLDNGAYPTTEQGLEALISAPETGTLPRKWRKGGYLEQRKQPADPWGYEFVYLSPGARGDYDIISYGADGAPGGEDAGADINNWEIE
jgi:general secretion pathway protein G